MTTGLFFTMAQPNLLQLAHEDCHKEETLFPQTWTSGLNIPFANYVT